IFPFGFDTRAADDCPFFARFEKTPGGPNGSELWRCKSCAQAWFVLLDDWDDYWYFERLPAAQAEEAVTGRRWPPTYDGFGATSDRPPWSGGDVARTFGSAFDVDFLFPETASRPR